MGGIVPGQLTTTEPSFCIFNWKHTREGIHIHCADAAVQKEGPSAGTALTVTLYSLFNGVPIPNNIGITGEINLSGEVLKIGGLRDKLYGAKRAGCTKCLFPADNLPDYTLILKKCPDLIEPGTFEARSVATLEEVFDIVFTDPEVTPQTRKRKRHSAQ